MKKQNFNMYGLSAKYFFPAMVIILICTYTGIMPTVKLADGLVGTTYVATFAFLMAVGGLCFWLGNKIPILNSYLGGACLLPLFIPAFMNHFGLVPETIQAGTKILLNGGFQDAYIAALLVGAVLALDRKVLLNSTARYIPAILGSQVFALLFCVIGGLVTGFGVKDALFNVGAPCMSGGSGGAMTTLPSLYSELSGQDMTGMAGAFLCYASIANVVAILMGAMTKKPLQKLAPQLVSPDADPTILRSAKNLDVQAGNKSSGTTDNYAALGGGIMLCFTIYLAGNLLSKLPGFNVIANLAWAIIIAIIIKCTGIMDEKVSSYCTAAMNFMIRAMLPAMIAGIGIKSMNLNTLVSFFSPAALVVVILAVLGAYIGAILFGHLFGLYGYESGITAGLCCCNIGGSGDIAVLTACDRMDLLAFASISTRIGGALMVVWIGILYRLLML